MYNVTRYRIMLQGEDGVSCLRDNITSYDLAESTADYLSSNYGEGQELFIEEYRL